ncbi:hypothetical protein [Salegentibacter sp. F14]
MRYKKIKGHKKIWKGIKEWEQQNRKLDLEELKLYQRKYLKVWVSPYCDYDMLNSETPEPYGKTRKMILESLLNIYQSWKESLEKLEEPYYLKIWLYEEHISRSQVVCALGDFIGFYENTFYQPNLEKRINLKNNYAWLRDKMDLLNWQYAPYEQGLTLEDIGEPYEYSTYKAYQQNKRSIRRKIKNAYRTKEGEDDQTYYFSKMGTVWIGGA